MSLYTRFGSMLAEQAANNQFPTVAFTDNADLRNTLNRLADLSCSKSSLESEQIKGAMESYSRVIGNQVENAPYTEVFSRVVGAFGKRLRDSVVTLHKMKNTVSKLCAVMRQEMDRRYAADAVLSAMTGKDADLTMGKVSWEVFQTVDERSIRANINMAIGRGINDEITRSRMMLAINQLPFANSYNALQLPKMELDDKTTARIITQVSNRFPKLASHARGLVNNILKLDEPTMRSMVRAAVQLAEGKTVNDLNRYLQLASEYLQVIDYLTPEVLNLSNATLEEYRKRAEVVDHYAQTILYIASYYRNELWKDSLLVPGPFINPDTYQDYVGKGGSMSEIVRHANHFFSKDPVPTKGVSGAFITQSAEGIKNTIAETVARNTKEIENKKREIERDTFIYLGTAYLTHNQKALDDKFAYRKDVSKYAASVYDSTANLPMASRFYRLLMNSYHINDLTSKLYDRLEKAYTESSEKLGQVTPEDKLKIDTGVYAGVVSEYLLDAGIVLV